MAENKRIIGRISIVYCAILLLSASVIIQIVRLQFNSELKESGIKRSFKEEELPALRGNIVANDGRLLAISLPVYELRMDCTVAHDTVFNKYVAALATDLANFFKDKSAVQYKSDLLAERKKGNKYKKINNRLVNYTELQQIKKFPIFKLGQNKGGLVTEQRYQRKYPYVRLAYRTLGWQNTEGIGVGIEDAFDSYLRGTPGKRMVQRLPGGDWMPVNSDIDLVPRDGMDVVTTLDVDIQDAAESALRGLLTKDPLFEGATAIVMETATGEIRAIANMERRSDNSYDETFNYAIGQATEPGSTFKLVTLMSLLEDNFVTLETPINIDHGRWRYKNNEFTDSHSGPAVLTMLEVFEQSSNVGFAKTAVNFYGSSIDKERRFIDRLYAMGLNKPLGLQIKGEKSPTMHYPEKNSTTWSGLTLPMMAMGYGLELTPMQTLTFYNAVANNGKMMRPKLVTRLQSKSGAVEKEYSPEVINSAICSPAVLREVKKAMRAVVEKGTARGVNDSRYAIAGKTGTARLLFTNKQGRKVYSEDGYRKHQASFVGFFPAEDPKYTAIVVLYSEKTRGNFYGATWAAPVFKQIADKLYVSSDWNSTAVAKADTPVDMPLVKGGKREEVDEVLRELDIPSKRLDKKVQWVGVARNEKFVEQVDKNVSKNRVPSVVNMGLKDALFLLENVDLQVSFSGKGRVMKQSIEPGSMAGKGQRIFLELGT